MVDLVRIKHFTKKPHFYMRLTIVHYAKSKLNKQCIKYVVKVFDTLISSWFLRLGIINW